MSVHSRSAPRVEPHADHDARPYEVEDGDHEEEDVGETPLVGLARLTRAMLEQVFGVVTVTTRIT